MHISYGVSWKRHSKAKSTDVQWWVKCLKFLDQAKDSARYSPAFSLLKDFSERIKVAR
jgi:hypothetical protein